MIRSLFDLLNRATAQAPERVALRMSGRTLTYEQFHARVNAVAHALRVRGLDRRDRVGVLMKRSFDSMAAIFGILQAGGVYVPLERSASSARSAAMLTNAGARFLVTDPDLARQAAEIVGESAGIRAVLGAAGGDSPAWESIYAERQRLAEFGLNERDMAVMFHTSGTTGVPKGVVHSHRSMLSVVEWAVHQFEFRPTDVFVGVTSHAFELSWLELFASIAAGGEIVLIPEETVMFSPAELAQIVASSGVSIWCSVPSLLMRLSEHGDLERRQLAALRRIHFAGERFPTKHLRRLMQQVPHPRFCNMLGTTETHICAFYEFRNGPPQNDTENIPVGRACAHVNLAAIGKTGLPVPDGEVGELVVRGPNLMNGYWELPDRTAQAIIDCRFAPDLVDKAYRTGDLVRKDERGDYHIIGRADRRIKVSGHLVDLDEVEAVLLARDGVLEAAAFSAGEEGFERVRAAVVPKPGHTLVAASLRVEVARTLPTSAVPERITIMDALPRLDNGKISRRAVDAAATEARSRASTSRSTDTSVVESLRRFIAEQILDAPATALDETEDLFDANILTSLNIVKVVTFIEQSHDVVVSNEDFVAKNFKTLGDICRMIERQRSTR